MTQNLSNESSKQEEPLAKLNNISKVMVVVKVAPATDCTVTFTVVLKKRLS